MNLIKLDPARKLGSLDRNVFGGFAEHLGRCIYGGIYDEGSPLADEWGIRQDVLAALRRLRMPVIRYPGGNFASGYCWRDGIGPKDERPARAELAWNTVESNRFGTDEFILFCRQLGAEPYLVVNCGDGSLREAREWVEYCNGEGTSLARLRERNGYPEPYRVKYWGIGNEVDGPWQIGMKTPQEYARVFTEFGKAMKMVDPEIHLIASWTSGWFDDWVERGQLLLEQAGNLVDYMAIHWYVGNREDDFFSYMGLSELFEERLSAAEGFISAMRTCRKIKRPIYLAVDEWNVWYRTGIKENLEEEYNLEDALVVALQLNAFLRHADSVKMANLAQIVNVIAPIVTRSDGLFLQTIFYPFELYSQQARAEVLDVYWEGETFQAGDQPGLRVLDLVGTLDEKAREGTLFVVNRSLKETEARIILQEGEFGEEGQAYIIGAPNIKAKNSFADPEVVKTKKVPLRLSGKEFFYTFAPHSVTGLVFKLR
ncbi:MAG: alpha-N-arabinofuranosidase [Anaerolineae bacterium]|nr:alpha-N-arabinofuranosidase [Anaerolineae bacterium]